MMIRHYFVYYNSTESILDGTWPFYCAITHLELVGIAVNYTLLLFAMYLMWRTSPYHFNIRIIWEFIGVEYFTQLTDRTLQIILIFNHEEDGQAFLATSLIRCSLYFIVSLLLPAIVVERLCACYYLKDYERKKRSHISFIILFSITSAGFVLSVEYHQAKSTLSLHISMLVINLVASMGNLAVERYNYRKLQESTNLSKSCRAYSLAERFQISENIRTCSMMKNVVNAVFIFNLLSTITSAMDNFDLPRFWENVAVTIFNICVLTYGTVTITLFYLHTEQFRVEATRIFGKIRGRAVVAPRVLRSTVGGANLMLNLEAQGHEYFAQLERDWNSPRSKNGSR